MPLYKKITTSSSTSFSKGEGEQTANTNFEIALWRIEEELAFFESKFNGQPDIKNENKRLQWYATRHLVNEMLGTSPTVIKDEAGKPLLENSSYHISLSHTTHFAAAIISERFPVGIDLEMVNPKVERIAHKFLRQDEINLIKEEEKTGKLILYWSAKEALYKLHGKGDIEFMTQLLIEPFELKPQGKLTAEITGIAQPLKNLNINYEFFEGHVLTYVITN
jgi:phosphopantetheinyl transferase